MFSFSLILFSLLYVSNQTVMWSKGTTPVTARVKENGGVSNRVIRSTTSCILPPYPDHGSYDVLNVDKAHPGLSNDQYLLLSVRCEHGYGMEISNGTYDDRFLMICDKGLWLQTIPKCIRLCKLDEDPSVDYQCLTPGVEFVKSCHGYLAPGTTVSPVCRSPDYFSDNEIMLDMECSQGRWNYVAKCKPVCGRVVDKSGTGLVVGGTYTSHGLVPWHVGLYKKTLSYEQICGGSIVTSKVVISAAHCFASRNTSDYAVAGGKIYRPWNVEGDVNAQKSDVKEIKIPKLYQGDVGRFSLDIAALIIATPFNLNPFVRPVCLSFVDTFDKWQLRHGNLGKVAGWGLTAANGPASEILKVVDFPVISEDSCLNTIPVHFRPYISLDKFCAGYINGTALCRGDSGGGLAFPDKEQGEDRFYLRGIVSTAAKTYNINKCNDLTYTAFTRVAKFQDFIKSAIAASERQICQEADCVEDCADDFHGCKSVTGTEMMVTTVTEKLPCQDGDCVEGKNAIHLANRTHKGRNCFLNHLAKQLPSMVCRQECVDDSSDCKAITTLEFLGSSFLFTERLYDPCIWEGIKGECVPAKVCLTALAEKSAKHLSCLNKDGWLRNICCTDCQLVNDTSNFVLSPEAKVFWKDGRKARDACLQYMKDLPHKCYQEGKRAGIYRFLQGSCHNYETWQQISNNHTSGWEHAYVAVLGPGNTPEDTNWYYVGTIISEKFILGNAYTTEFAPLKYAAVGVKDGTSYNKSWQTHPVKKMHLHPEYKKQSARAKYNDIALIELETSINFGVGVLPACLPDPIEEFDVTNVEYFVWQNNYSGGNLNKLEAERCSTLTSDELPQKIDSNSQLCVEIPGEHCLRLFNESTALIQRTQYSCMNTVIGIASFILHCNTAVFINVKHYTPWIESIVWPS